MNTSGPIVIFNRYTQKYENELVYGDKLVRLLYETPAGQKAAGLLAKPFLSKLYGKYQDSHRSSKVISDFIRDLHIDMSDYEEGPFQSFNDFFIRKFRTGKRNFVSGSKMAAFAEARYLGFDQVSDETIFPVKGKFMTAAGLIGNNAKAEPFKGGPLLIARLCPTDYHRFHYPDDGRTLDSFAVAGQLHSVNPIALKFKSDIFATNERVVSILDTKNFGKLAYIEVGALCVGKIVQSHVASECFKRGDEKGYFLFGGSTVIVLGENGKWRPSDDIIRNTFEQRETYIHLGDEVAHLRS